MRPRLSAPMSIPHYEGYCMAERDPILAQIDSLDDDTDEEFSDELGVSALPRETLRAIQANRKAQQGPPPVKASEPVPVVPVVDTDGIALQVAELINADTIAAAVVLRIEDTL